MKSQTALVDVLGTFHPKIVQMDGTDPRNKDGEKTERMRFLQVNK
jgi:hypothetical protein